MSLSDDPTRMSRRSAILTFGSGAAVGVGGLYVLSKSGTAEVEGKTSTTVEDASAVLGPDGTVEDVTLTGTVSISYESPDIPIRELEGGLTVIYLRNESGGPDPGSIEDFDKYQRAETADNHQGSHTFDWSVSLIDDWGFEAGDFDPDPGEKIELDFQVVALVSLFENVGDERHGDEVETFGDEHYGTVVVEREESSGDDAQEPLLTVHSADFSFGIDT